jgi:galactonate dehydratase
MLWATDNTVRSYSVAAMQDPYAKPLTTPSETDGRFTTRQNRITKIETYLVKPRWLFLEMHTEEGIVGLGEPILEGRALTCQVAVKELEPWLIGEDPTRIVHLWQAMYRHTFYRGGEILTSALSGVEQALWDIYGKMMGVPVYKLLGGPTRDKIRIYGTAGGRTPEAAAQSTREAVALGFNAIKTGVGRGRRGRLIETEQFTEDARAVSPLLHRRAGAVAERGRAGRHHPLHPRADRYRRAPLHQVGLPRSARKARR